MWNRYLHEQYKRHVDQNLVWILATISTCDSLDPPEFEDVLEEEEEGPG